MAQVTPEEAGLAEFSPRGTQAEELQFLIAYYIKLLQTGGMTFSGEVEVKNDSGNPVPISGTVTIAANQSVNLAQVAGTNTVTGGTAGTQSIGGIQAHDSPVSGNNPILTGGYAVDPTSLPADVTAADLARILTNLKGILLNQQADLSGSFDSVKPYALPASDWQYAAAANGISNTTTAVTIKASAGGSLRNYITAIQIYSDALGAATEFAIRDGAAGAVLWRTKIGTAGRVNGDPIVFPTPIRGSAATLLEVVTLTASITGAVYFNAQGYSAT